MHLIYIIYYFCLSYVSSVIIYSRFTSSVITTKLHGLIGNILIKIKRLKTVKQRKVKW